MGGMLLGVIALGFFVFNLLFLQGLKSRMVNFEPVTRLDKNRILLTGAGLLIYLIFCLILLFG